MATERTTTAPTEHRLLNENETVQIGRFLLTEAVEFAGNDLELAEKWLERQIGDHQENYRYFTFSEKFERWKREKSSGGEVKTAGVARAYRFSLPAEGLLKEGVKESSILLIATNRGGFCLVSPDVSIKEAEIAYLARLHKIGKLKALPAIKIGLPIEKLSNLDKHSTGSRIGALVRDLGKERVKEIWFLLREALDNQELHLALGQEAVVQLRYAWNHLCYDYTEAGWTYVRDPKINPSNPDQVHTKNLPLPGYTIYDNPKKPPRLSFKDIAPETLGYRMVYEGLEKEGPIFPDEVTDVSGLSVSVGA